MDNLPAPVDGKRPAITFYARKKIYRPEDFVKIPAEYGYDDIDQLAEHGLSLGRPIDKKAANTFLQEWLYFSLFARVIDEDIDSAEFYDRRDNVVQTRNNIVERKLARWKERERVSDVKGCSSVQARYVRASDTLLIARRFVSKHVSHEAQKADDGRPGHRQGTDTCARLGDAVHEAVDTKLTLSIATLGEILQRERPRPPEAACAYRDEFWQDWSSESRRWGYSKYCRRQLQINNWCPSEIPWLESTMPGVCEVYYASSKRRKRQYDHSACSFAECKAPPLEALGHVEGECSGKCADLGLDEKEVDRVINAGKTPLVTCSSAHGELSLHQFDLESDPPAAFGALSHAWEDKILHTGLDPRGGNNRRVYQCRLRKIQNDFNKLVKGGDIGTQDGDVPFYVDTLCYPRQIAVQQIALNQIQLVYSKAKAVLVLDRDLLSERKLSASRAIEMNVKIRTGNWTKSLWTLLEAVLANKNSLAVAFSDGMVTFNELEIAKQSAQRSLFHEYHHVYEAGHPFSHAIYQLQKLETLVVPKFRPQKVWNAVQFQKIDKQENEAPILAALMKVDVTKFATGELSRPDFFTQTREDKERVASRRMMRLLESMNETPGLGIPSGLIFLPFPKLRNDKFPETKQFGWAPRTWLTKQAHPRSLKLPLRTTARILTNGLLVRYPGLALCSASPLVGRKFWVPVTQSMHKWYKVVAYPPQTDLEMWWQAHMSIRKALVIILSEANPREEGAIGLLVRPKGLLSDGQIQLVDSLCQVWVRLETDREIIKGLCQSFRQKSKHALIGRSIAEQDWCVDGLAGVAKLSKL
jgi:hypothetical protein